MDYLHINADWANGYREPVVMKVSKKAWDLSGRMGALVVQHRRGRRKNKRNFKMNELTKEEVAGWIRTLIPYLEKPAMLAPEGFFDDDEYKVKPAYIVEYGDNLCPQSPVTVLSQIESVKVLVDLYKSLER